MIKRISRKRQPHAPACQKFIWFGQNQPPLTLILQKPDELEMAQYTVTD